MVLEDKFEMSLECEWIKVMETDLILTKKRLEAGIQIKKEKKKKKKKINRNGKGLGVDQEG